MLEKLDNFSKPTIFYFLSFKTKKIYDIGSTFFEDIKNANLRIGDVDLSGKYYLHFEGMSWYKNRFDATSEDTGIDFGGTHNNINYVHAYEQKYKHFKKFVQINNLDCHRFVVGAH